MRFSLCKSVSVTNEISVLDKHDFKKSGGREVESLYYD